ncbi:MAG: hypothetical protein RJB01_752 [Actinomycetota bacterium]|jgi:PncC family amidohydrolase
MTSGPLTLAEALISELRARHWTLSTAESLTGGGLGSLITAVPGASDVYLGGLITYSIELKANLLGLSSQELAAGVVSEVVAEAMASRVRTLTGADVGLATTGAAGPEPHGGAAPGTVCLAVSQPDVTLAWTVQLTGGRDQVRAAAISEILRVAAEQIARA